MSQRTDKKMRRAIRKEVRKGYNATIERLATSDARWKFVMDAMRPKPKLIPAFVWIRIVNIIMKPPKEINADSFKQ
jgi:hypothetical protein